MTTVPFVDIDEEDEGVESVVYADLDLKRAAELMTTTEARFVVDYYYQVQEYRKRTKSQAAALKEAQEPTILTNWLAQQMVSTEAHIKKYLDVWSDASPVGRWSKSNVGIGPVIAAGLLAHINMNIAKHPSQVWNYAGLNPQVEWLGKERASAMVSEVLGKNKVANDNDIIAIANLTLRNWVNIKALAVDEEGVVTATALRAAMARRPWNADFKVLCWKAGDCFVKFSNHPKTYYGRLYKERKAREIVANQNGAFAKQAEQVLATKNFSRDTTAKQAYEKGQLPDGHIHARAMRYAVKIFLAHWHQVAYETTFNEPAPLPYATVYMGHEDYMPPPNYTPLPR